MFSKIKILSCLARKNIVYQTRPRPKVHASHMIHGYHWRFAALSYKRTPLSVITIINHFINHYFISYRTKNSDMIF